MATYQEAIDWLDENFPFFLTLVLNLGDPVVDESVPTACVRNKVNPTEGELDWEFAISPIYFEDFSPGAFAGVISHETLHIALSHLSEVTQTELYPHAESLTLAHEAIINDRLVNEGFEMPEGEGIYGPKLVGEDLSELSTLDAYHVVFDKLFKDLPQTEGSAGESEKNDDSEASGSRFPASSSGGSGGPSQGDSESPSSSPSGGSESDAKSEQDSGDQGGENGAQNGSGEVSDNALDALSHSSCGGVQLTEEVAEKLREAIRESASNASDDDKQEVSDTLLEELGVEEDSGMFSKGSGAGSVAGKVSVENIAEEKGIKFAWAKLLADVNPDILKKKGRAPARYRSSWSAPRRNLTHLYPEIFVPSRVRKGEPDKKGTDGDKKPLMVLALDLSGSIDRTYVERMIQLARTIPDDLIEVECCTFSTEAIPFDPNSLKNKLASGGTSFGCVEEFALKAAKKHGVTYPKAIVCITDGEATFGNYYYDTRPKFSPTQEQFSNNWNWLMIESHNRLGVLRLKHNKERIRRLSDYL